MTEKQVKDFLSLNEKFNNRCDTVCQLLQPFDNSFGYLDTFEPDGDFVYGEGDEYWGYGGHEHHGKKFPLKYLWLKDDEIEAIVKQAVEDKERQIKEKKEKEQREQEERLLESQRKLYEELKRKFE